MVSLTAPDAADHSEWHLPTYDPRNENIYHYKLHSVEIYFWMPKDAVLFVNGIRRVLPPAQVEVLDEPGPPPTQAPAPAMSPVVQQLEKTVISDPRYSSPHTSEQKSQAFSPPPISAVSHSEPPANFVPMAYNPAAPAAPEAVRHREKTPPPDDDGINPLAVAVAIDYQQQPFSPGFAPPPGHPGVASPGFPPSQYGTHPGLQRSATMPAHAGLASPGLASPYGNAFPGSPGFAPPPQGQMGRPTPPITSPGLPGPPPPPPGGYSQFSYNTQQASGTPRQEYNVHQQAYRPTEGEVNERYNRKKQLEEHAGRFERGVGGMFKKFEKKFG